MQFCKPPAPSPLLPQLTLGLAIICLDQGTTLTFDLDPKTTTVATLQTLVADRIKAGRRALGLRVFRNSLSPTEIMLTFGGGELRQEEKLDECSIKDGSVVEATVRLTDEGVRLMQVRAQKGEEMKKRKDRRAKLNKAYKLREQIVDFLQQQAELRKRKSTHEPEESSAEESSALDDELAATEGELQRTEDNDQEDRDDMEEAPHVARQRLGAGSPVDWVEEVAEGVAEVDPFDDYDGNKENWDPQILRAAGRDIDSLQAS